MTTKEALEMLVGAERYVWSLIPEKAFISEYPDLAAAMERIQWAERQLRRQLRNNQSRRAKHAAYADLGLKRVRGNLGGAHYE